LISRLTGQTLLFFDSVEQAREAGSFLSDLLNACPQLKLLIASRQALAIPQEHEYHVVPLAVPEQRQVREPEQLMHYGAIALFVQQARLARNDFCLTSENAA